MRGGVATKIVVVIPGVNNMIFKTENVGRYSWGRSWSWSTSYKSSKSWSRSKKWIVRCGWSESRNESRNESCSKSRSK